MSPKESFEAITPILGIAGLGLLSEIPIFRRARIVTDVCLMVLVAFVAFHVAAFEAWEDAAYERVSKTE